VWATTKLTQDFVGTTAAARTQADVLVLEPSPAVRLDQGFDGSFALIQPRLQLEGQPAGTGADYPTVIASWTVDGVEPGAILEGALVVGSDLEACSETWARPVIASRGGRRTGDHQIGPLGYEVTRGGGPPLVQGCPSASRSASSAPAPWWAPTQTCPCSPAASSSEPPAPGTKRPTS